MGEYKAENFNKGKYLVVLFFGSLVFVWMLAEWLCFHEYVSVAFIALQAVASILVLSSVILCFINKKKFYKLSLSITSYASVIVTILTFVFYEKLFVDNYISRLEFFFL
jgi:hypothetical protein